MRWWRMPLVRFSAVSLLVMAAALAVLHSTVQDRVEARSRLEAVQSAEFVTRITVERVLRGVDLTAGPLSPRQQRQLDDIVRTGVRGEVLVQLKVFDRDQRIVHALDRTTIGEQRPGWNLISEALAGRSGSELAGGGDAAQGVLLESFIPLHLDDDAQPDGVAELYTPYASVQAEVERDSSRLLLRLGGGLLALWLALIPVVASISRRLRRELAHNTRSALHDALTDLPNRTLFFDRLSTALASSRRTGRTAAVLVLDLDGFKDVNDTHGHHAGDVLLQEVAARLTSTTRESDTVSRLGGDEFAVVLTELGDLADVGVAAGRLLAAFGEPFLVGGTRTAVLPSIGVAVLGVHADGADELVQRADAAMYAAKRGGGGIAWYDVARDDVAGRTSALTELRAAIEHGELVLHYQPAVGLTDRRVSGAEALVRWRHPTRGLLPPSEFVPLAESSALIAPLTAWVLDEAVRQCRAWVDADLDLCVAVNLSARSVVDDTLPDVLAAVLARHGLAPDRLVVEITETSLITRPDDARRILLEVVALGVNIAVDDFGTGYATLAWLQKLPFNALKIDRGFVADLATGGPGAELVRYTTQLAHALGKSVVAEGVETREQWEALARMGVDMAQGYAIARPLPAADFADWLDAWIASAGRPLVLERVG